MRQSTVATTVLLMGVIGAITWTLVRSRNPPPTATATTQEAPPPVPPVPRPELGKPIQWSAPTEPTPPAAGTPEHQAYFRALAAGNERTLAHVRKALSEVQRNKTATGHVDEAYLRTLERMERTYAQALERHRNALRSDHGP